MAGARDWGEGLIQASVELPISGHPIRSSLGGCSQEVVPYESLDHSVSKFLLITI